MKHKTLTILGAGSWGTAMALHFARAQHHVYLWTPEKDQVASMKKNRENVTYLPQIPFPDTLYPTHDLKDCIERADHVFIAVPSHAFNEVLQLIVQATTHRPLLHLAWLTKGLGPKTNQFLSEIVEKQYGKHFPMAISSGPSFAKEVAQDMPTALIISGNHMDYLQTLKNLTHAKTLRAYLSQDMIGVQLCGAIKNVLAIACGISDGLKYGANTQAALITRGLHEMIRLGLALGAQQETFLGLAGIGDLVLTCTDNQSRNRRFGLLLGQGLDRTTATARIGQVVEGQQNTTQICALAQKAGIELPICSQVYAILQGQTTPQEAAQWLLDRPIL